MKATECNHHLMFLVAKCDQISEDHLIKTTK
jgi:hypothetical protein